MDKFPHNKNCRCGTKMSRLPLKKNHNWYVKSAIHHNCFFTYMKHNVRPHTLQEVADLLNLSISAITAIERKAFIKIRGKADLSQYKRKILD